MISHQFQYLLLIGSLCSFNIFLINEFNWVALFISLISFVSSYWLNNKSKKIILVFLIGIICFGFNFGEKLAGSIYIVESKSTYAIGVYNASKFYIPDYDHLLKIGQAIQFTAIVDKLDLQVENYGFNFNSYLFQKMVYYRLDNFEILASTDNWRTISYDWLINFNEDSFYQNIVFGINNHQPHTQILEKNGLSYLNSLNIFIYFFILKIINRIIKKPFILILSQFLVILWVGFLVVTLNFPILSTRFWLGLIITLLNYKKNIHIKSENRNFILIFLCMILFPSFMFTSSFWYVSISMWILNKLYLKTNNYWTLMLQITMLYIPIQIYFEYRFNLMLEVWTLVILPLNYLIYLIMICFGYISDVSLFCQNIYMNVIDIVDYFSFNINAGYISVYLVVIWYIYVFMSIEEQNSWKYWIKIIFIFIMFWFFMWLSKPNVTLTMLNVGNGNSFVFYDKWKNTAIMFDCGTGTGFNKQMPFNYLKYVGINHLDVLFISHFHSDHYNGLFAIEENMTIKQIIDRNIAQNFYEFNDYRFWVWNNSINSFNSSTDENSNSLVILFQYGNFVALFTGDLTKEAEYWLITSTTFAQTVTLFDIDVLQIGHHGSKTSTSEIFLKLVNPKLALISGAQRGKLHFPNIETLNILNKYDIPYLITNGIKMHQINIYKK